MKIETKFEPGKVVWFIADNQLKKAQILESWIKCVLHDSGINGSHIAKHISYKVYGYPSFIPENLVFSSKEDLIKSL